MRARAGQHGSVRASWVRLRLSWHSPIYFCPGNRLISLNALSIFGSFVHCGWLVYYCRACLADDLILGIRASRTTNCADDCRLLDQWNAASRGNDSIERE